MALSEAFMSDLLVGRLAPLRSFLIDDQSLCPEIRANTLTIYYRGGGLLKLQEFSGNYRATFGEEGYIAACVEPRSRAWASKIASLPGLLTTEEETEQWLSDIPYLKSVMDRWFVSRTWREREAQQRIVLENNRDGAFANSTDFYFCDMEFAENQNFVNDAREPLRFDLVGVHWPSKGTVRQKVDGRSLVIAEAKYGDDALENLMKHYKDLNSLVRDERRLARLKEMLVLRFQQKHRLGFIESSHPITGFSDGRVLWLLILINHDPESRRLRDGLAELVQMIGSDEGMIDVRIATSNFMGYGLWDQGLMDLNSFTRDCGARIYCRGN
jgi:hypothetical protein